MTDKELLELAAKAAGYTITENSFDVNGEPWFWCDELAENWNPLTNDGDALRLAVKLGIDIGEALGWYYNNDEDDEYQKDPYATTRRAIVRAAAEIGEAL